MPWLPHLAYAEYCHNAYPTPDKFFEHALTLGSEPCARFNVWVMPTKFIATASCLYGPAYAPKSGQCYLSLGVDKQDNYLCSQSGPEYRATHDKSLLLVGRASNFQGILVLILRVTDCALNQRYAPFYVPFGQPWILYSVEDIRTIAQYIEDHVLCQYLGQLVLEYAY